MAKPPALEKKSSHPSSGENTFTALYRKYRPMNWDQVVDQDNIVQSLQAEVAKVTGGAQPHHAYLFAGSRGTGKTTLARIFAQQIGTASEDIYEIDAASNTSVEDIRNLTEGVYALPLVSKYKVYILDEVHMLSKSAFNAFLKTLEEPPKHVIFILATTELHKIPETIISRCQVFHFNTPTHDTLAQVIVAVAQKEGVNLSTEAARLVATVARGSFRDALSALQGVVGRAHTLVGDKSSDKKKLETVLEIEEVEKYLSIPPQALVEQFIDTIINAEAKEGLESGFKVLSQIHKAQHNVHTFTEYIMVGLREVLIENNGIGKEAGKAGRMLGILLELVPSIGKTYIGVLPLELALVRFFEVK